jgi:hypothetical protein
MVVALISLFIALGGVAWAANTIGSSDVIDESLQSVDLKNGEVRGADVQDNSLTGADIAESLLGKVPNADKLDGMDSSQFASSLWAVVGIQAGGAALVRGHGAALARRLAPGVFLVRFDRDITHCGYLASAGDLADGAAPPLLATVEQRDAGSAPRDVVVRMFKSGAPTDPGMGEGFHLAVFC